MKYSFLLFMFIVGCEYSKNEAASSPDSIPEIEVVLSRASNIPDNKIVLRITITNHGNKVIAIGESGKFSEYGIQVMDSNNNPCRKTNFKGLDASMGVPFGHLVGIPPGETRIFETIDLCKYFIFDPGHYKITSTPVFYDFTPNASSSPIFTSKPIDVIVLSK